jgi:hypothetical protein
MSFAYCFDLLNKISIAEVYTVKGYGPITDPEGHHMSKKPEEI